MNIANPPKPLAGPTLVTPMEKPPQPLPDRTTGNVPMMTGVEGGWPLRTDPGSLKVNISGSGHSTKKAATAAQKARIQVSESDALNRAQLKMIQARNAAKQAARSTILIGEQFA